MTPIGNRATPPDPNIQQMQGENHQQEAEGQEHWPPMSDASGFRLQMSPVAEPEWMLPFSIIS